MLFGALRTENFERFRKVCIDGLRYLYDNKDDRGQPRPSCVCDYMRVKDKSKEEQQRLAIVCFCPGGKHEPITSFFNCKRGGVGS